MELTCCPHKIEYPADIEAATAKHHCRCCLGPVEATSKYFICDTCKSKVVKKWLTVCEGGVVRSGAIAFQLKSIGQDAIQGSWKWNTPETFKHLLDWCDYVILMQSEFVNRIPMLSAYPEKVKIVDVGPDVFGNPLHYGLNKSLERFVLEWNARDFNLG